MGFGRKFGIAAVVLGVVVVGVGAWVRSLLWFPDDTEPVPVTCTAEAPPVPAGRPVKVLVWNVQYAGSRRHHFFYDGGRAVHVPRRDVEETLDAVAEVIRREDPDVVLLQEVDRDSARTHRIDQLAELLARVPYPCHASTPYHRVGYVPTPPWRPLGRVDMHLVTLSRYRLDAATRIQLPLLDEPTWRQWFNLRRAVLDVTAPVDDGRTLRLLNTHLSAFSRGDGTLERQMAVLDALATASETRRQPWVLGGDLNSLPPGDDARRLPDGPVEYPEDPPPVTRLFQRFASVVPAQQYAADPERWRTYLPYGADRPDRTLDYVFTGRTVDVRDVRVSPDLDVSDHLPIVVELVIE